MPSKQGDLVDSTFLLGYCEETPSCTSKTATHSPFFIGRTILFFIGIVTIHLSFLVKGLAPWPVLTSRAKYMNVRFKLYYSLLKPDDRNQVVHTQFIISGSILSSDQDAHCTVDSLVQALILILALTIRELLFQNKDTRGDEVHFE